MAAYESEGEFVGGAEVRLKSDPGRRGILTGRQRSLGGVPRYQVQFPDQKSYQPDYELELVENEEHDPYELVERGRFGRAVDLRRNLSHVHLSGRVANLVYSMDATNTDFLAYQFKPVLSFLESPSNGLLIADEVGLGKTIEAGLIWTELRARFDARRLLILCPAMLREKWKYELRERFSVEADIFSAGELLEELSRPKTDTLDGRGMICSLQGLRPPPSWWEDENIQGNARARLARFLQDSLEQEPPIDLLVVDEAHYLRNPETQSAKLGELLRDASESCVLLSATPINLKDDDLFHLLRLVDPDTFDIKEMFPQVLEANAPLQRARNLVLDPNSTIHMVREVLEVARDHSILALNRQLAQLLDQDLESIGMETQAARVEVADRIDRINLLRHAITRTRKSEVTEWRVIREAHVEQVPMSSESGEADLYTEVTEAIRRYAVEREISEGFLLATPQRQISSCMYAAVKSWRERAFNAEETVYEDTGQTLDGAPDLSPLITYLNQHVANNVDLERLRSIDSKYNRFRDELSRYFESNPGEKVIVFSYFRGTLEYLQERLTEDGIRPVILYGGMRENKSEVIERFRTNRMQQVLLSSEVASEGVDLQFSRVVVNYDLPWNPMKIEQRIGRVDRIGQKADKISIWNLLYANTIDERIYNRLCERLGIFERALGGMEVILGDEVAQLTADLLREKLTPEQEERRIEQTALAIEQKRTDQEQVESQASELIAHGGYIVQQAHAAHEFKHRITSEDLEAYTRDYLERNVTGYEFRQTNHAGKEFLIRLPGDLASQLQEYIRRSRMSSRTRIPSGERVRCVFDNKVQHPKDPLERISQFHPLIRFIASDLNARDEALYPLVAVRVPGEVVSTDFRGPVAFKVDRWSFEGLRVEEEIRMRVAPICEDVCLSMEESSDILHGARTHGSDWLDYPGVDASDGICRALETCEVTLEQDYQRVARQRRNENEDRVGLQLQSVKKHRDRQIEIRQSVLEQHRRFNRQPLIRATEGQIAKIRQRCDQQESRLRRHLDLRHSRSDVCCGIALIE